MHETLRALREKYVEMRAMRTDAVIDPRDRMRALAERFPGALREIDELPLETIDARIDAIDRALEGEAVPRWARYLAEYHSWLRAAVQMRLAAGKARDRSLAIAWIRERDASQDPSPAELELAIDDLLRPPEGRLTRWVFARIAAREGRTVEDVEGEAFPPSTMRAARFA